MVVWKDVDGHLISFEASYFSIGIEFLGRIEKRTEDDMEGDYMYEKSGLGHNGR